MMIARLARSWQRLVCDSVVAEVARRIIAPRYAFAADRAATVKIQTKLQTMWMKSASPVKGMLGSKVVPLDRDPDLVYIAVQRTPSIFYLTPGHLLGCATGVHLT